MNDKHKEAGKLLLRYLQQMAKEQGLTEVEIARRSGFIQQNVNRMFLGKYMPSLDNFLRLGEAIGVRLELHAPGGDVEDVKIRNLDIPQFLFAPNATDEELYIVHTHYPACIIKVVQTIPASFEVVQNFDNSGDFEDVLQEALEFYRAEAGSLDVQN